MPPIVFIINPDLRGLITSLKVKGGGENGMGIKHRKETRHDNIREDA